MKYKHPTDLHREMKGIAYAISRREDVDSCIVICRKYSIKYFIKLEMKSGNVYGISYVYKTGEYMLWDSFGEYKDYAEQYRIVFSDSSLLLYWLCTKLLDIDAAFEHLRKEGSVYTAWSSYDLEELERKYGKTKKKEMYMGGCKLDVASYEE